MVVSIFFCYAHKDETLLKQLKAHLRPLQQQGLIAMWHDRDITAGAEWEHEIGHSLNSAHIILLLISSDFMNSDYCYSIEMRRAVERHNRGEALVIPIILRHCYWQGEPLGKLQALPTGAKPVTGSEWHTQDEALFNVTQGIHLAIEKIFSGASRSFSSKQKQDQKARMTKSVPASRGNNTPPYILVLDDDRFANEIVRFVLNKEDFVVKTADNPLDAFLLIQKQEPALLLLNVAMPSLNGLAFAEKLHAEGYQIPFIFMTAQDTLETKLHGFNLGADDYLCKPYNHQELVARVRVVMRRYREMGQQKSKSIRRGELELFSAELKVVVAGHTPVTLTPTEMQVLRILMMNQGHMVNREQLVEAVWSSNETDPQIVDVYIRRLRVKLGEDADKPRYIMSVRGLGYQFVE
jgi:DNA-binding response OmpR family regulator